MAIALVQRNFVAAFLLLTFSIPLANLAPTTLCADEPEFMVGFGRRKTTPKESVWMSGYSGRRRGSEGVLDELHAQAICIRDSIGGKVLLLRVDVCVMRDPTITQICNLIQQKTGLLRREILVNVSHTHSGPAVNELYHYSMSTTHRERLAAYTERLKALCADAAVDAVKDLKSAHLDFGFGAANFFHNRRGLDEKGRYIGMIPNANNHTDRKLPVLRVTNPDGSVRGIVFGVACHNVTLGVNYQISGDFAGQARIQLEKEIPNALFMTGCGADANPIYGSNGIDQVQKHGVAVATEVKRVLKLPMQRIKGPIQSVFRYVDLPLVAFTNRTSIEKMRNGPYADFGNVNKLLSILDRGAKVPTSFAAPVTVWQLGNDLTLVGLPEESVSEYVPLITKSIGKKNVWISAYCNDVSGYLPTVNIMKQGGYETRGMIADNQAGWFAPESEKTLIDAVTQMVKTAKADIAHETIPTKTLTFHAFQTNKEKPMAGCKSIGNVDVSQDGWTFDGKGYLERAPISLPLANKHGLTMAAWVKPTQAGLKGTRMIFCEWANTVNDDRLSLSLNDGHPGLGVADGRTGELGFASGQSIPADKWTFVAASWSPRTRRYNVYVNGKLTATSGIQSGSGIRQPGKTTFKIGGQAAKEFPRMFKGSIGAIWIGNALNPAAMKQLYEKSRASRAR